MVNLKIEELYLLVIWTNEAKIKRFYICYTWDEANELGMKFEEDATIDGDFHSLTEIEAFLNDYEYDVYHEDEE